jgi:hypothetical protein
MRKTRVTRIGTDGYGRTLSTGDQVFDRMMWKVEPGYEFRPHYRTDRCVYFIHAPALRRVKIGTTTALKRRLRDIQRQPELRGLELVLVGYLDGGDVVERLIHDKFREQRISHEWFDESILGEAHELIALDSAWFGS